QRNDTPTWPMIPFEQPRTASVRSSRITAPEGIAREPAVRPSRECISPSGPEPEQTPRRVPEQLFPACLGWNEALNQQQKRPVIDPLCRPKEWPVRTPYAGVECEGCDQRFNERVNVGIGMALARKLAEA